MAAISIGAEVGARRIR